MQGTHNQRDICSPIINLNQLLFWKCDKQCWIHYHDVVNLNDRSNFLNSGCVLDIRSKKNLFPEFRLNESLLPKTIFCHDYKGGYVQDRYCNGTSDANTYRFFNWAGIDLFIYFSHKLVTIPPQGWLNAGHVHGVPVLGTLITEWKEGEAIWNEILVDLDKVNLFARKLAEVCAHFKFDGYLINIENEIPKDWMSRLVCFVGLLKANLDLYCGRKTWLIWYDSVTLDGELKWQNKLCSINKPFFDACDGIFLNYCWTPADLMESIQTAGQRKHDVFVGVDVWGRNCYQDGGFNVDKAMTILRSLNMSAALFACGWTYETLSPSEEFLPKEKAFWKKFWPYLYTHGPKKLPFSTNFCQGISSRESAENPWFNLALQQYQPTAQACCPEHDINNSCISLCMTDGLEVKGGCLKVSSATELHSKLFHRVIVCNFPNPEEKSTTLMISLALKSLDTGANFRIFFVVEDKISIEGKKTVSMSTRPKGYRTTVAVDNMLVTGSVVDFTAERQTTEPKIRTLDKPHPLPHGWNKVNLILTLNTGQALTEILLLPPHSQSVLWAHLRIEDTKEVHIHPTTCSKSSS